MLRVYYLVTGHFISVVYLSFRAIRFNHLQCLYYHYY